MRGLGKTWQLPLGIVVAWVVLTVLALFSRHALPIDETRYLSVAWEMWLRGDLLVPHLNGEPYHHKPPLLFWLINLAWTLFGVSEPVARLVPALAGLAGSLLAMPLAAQLWPGQRRVAAIAAWMVFSTLFWSLWTTAVMFDLLVAVCAEIALLGVLLAWRGRAPMGWFVAGLGIGLGILAKGPVVLVYLLPAAVLAPWWMTAQRPSSWTAWYLGLLGALALGAAIGLAWALPAAAAGGEDFANHLLWGQTTGRMVESFAHRRPIWWYLPLLPILLFPWSVWSPLWRGVRARWREGWESGERLAVSTAACGLLIFSLVSGKQVHYLLPLFPVLALFAARALTPGADAQTPRAGAMAVPMAPLVLIGLIVLVLPYLGLSGRLPDWVAQLSPLTAVPIVAALALAVWLARRIPSAVWPGVVSLLFLIAVYPGLFRDAARNYQLVEVASLVGGAQGKGRTVAYVGNYHGEFNFAGRLQAPVAGVRLGALDQWERLHPGALVAQRMDGAPEPGDGGVHYWQSYRGGYLVLRDAGSIPGRLPTDLQRHGSNATGPSASPSD